MTNIISSNLTSVKANHRQNRSGSTLGGSFTPNEYDVFYPHESETMLAKRFARNTNEPSVCIKVQPARGQALQQVADQIAQVYAISGTEPIRQPLTIDEEATIILDALSGLDPNYQEVVLHNDHLYYLFFIEIDRNKPEMYAHFEMLYSTATQSINYPETNSCPQCQASKDKIQEIPPGTMVSSWVWPLCVRWSWRRAGALRWKVLKAKALSSPFGCPQRNTDIQMPFV